MLLSLIVTAHLACVCHGISLRLPNRIAKDVHLPTTTQRGQSLAADLAAGGPAGIQVAARQALFDYGTAVALQVLQDRVQTLHVPDVSKTFSIPVVGSFELQLSNIVVTNFSCSKESSKLTILDGGCSGAVGLYGTPRGG